jgi:predicted nuclease of restriction endonuclease-like (RecB) superfamily
MRVDSPQVRAYYERESAASNWSKRDLERQIATQYYERILSSKDKQSLIDSTAKTITPLRPIDVLKDPMILEFLNLPDSAALHESDLEQAIVSDIKRFLLELGKGFSFVARQQRLRFDDQDFYVDLVFYNYLLKCFVLVDLKIGELTHQDIGQMDGYVRMYEEQHKDEGHNPTLGLVLCSQKNAAVARYSVLQGSQQLFASKYLMYLPTEEQLGREIERQRALIEDRLSAKLERSED